MLYEVVNIINDEPTFEKPLREIFSTLSAGGAIKILSPLEYHTERQRNWFKGICLPHLVAQDENGETTLWWDDEVKRRCGGLKYLKKEIYFLESTDGVRVPIGRLTIKGVGKKNMTNFIEEILSKSMELGWDVPPPDKALRRK